MWLLLFALLGFSHDPCEGMSFLLSLFQFRYGVYMITTKILAYIPQLSTDYVVINYS
jgi:hypothetical protein